MIEIMLGALIILAVLNLGLGLFKKPNAGADAQFKKVIDLMIKFESTLERTEKLLKDEFQRNRFESNKIAKDNREELLKSLQTFSEQFSSNVKNLTESVDKQFKSVREDSSKQLDRIRETVDEKLQKTLNERISQSFDSVGKQLQAVQEGLGEMKNLATDVGGLKKVLSNVKMRGSFGETQLEMLLEQILAPDQFSKNVKTKVGSSEIVEFAIKLPGRDECGTPVWLPIDAKFPKDLYDQLLNAYEKGDPDEINAAKKNLASTIKSMAKDIQSKYLDPPNTTDFGIMFLPFEGIFAEVVRDVTLLETLQRDHKTLVTGPTTLAAILNSLQMGFKTLAIEKRSSEVWKVLGAVKKEFEKFGGLMDKAHKSIQTGLNHIDDVRGKRTRAIERSLKNVESLSDAETNRVITELMDSSSKPDNEEDE